MNDTGEGEPGPWVTVTTPESGLVRMRITAWRQAPDGSWWAGCTLSLWSIVETPDGRTRAEPYPVECWVSADQVQPVPGESYTAVRRTRSTTVRQKRTLAERVQR